MPTITAVETIPTTIPYHHAIEASSGVLDRAEHVLILVRTDVGATGIGEAVSRSFVYGESQESIVAAVQKWIAPILVGEDPFAVNAHHEALAWIAGNNTALGAVDIALHDLRGTLSGLPAWKLLGGEKRPMRVTRILSMGSPADSAREARAAAETHGISSFKVKVGDDVADDLSRVTAVREAVGPQATVYVDANHGYTAEQAVEMMNAAAEFGVTLIEEPTPAEDRLGRRRFGTHTTAAIMADESAPTLAATAAEILEGGARAISIKTTRTGFTESAQIVALARALGARSLLGSKADSMIGAAASLCFGSAHPAVVREPAELDYYTTLTDTLTSERLVVSNGVLHPSDRPGIGVLLDEEKVRRYRVD